MKITIIAACDRNGTIGSNRGGIPWHLPRDTAHFRAYCRGKWMLLGRRTHQEMQGWFERETPIVVTTNPDYSVPGGFCVSSIAAAAELALNRGVDELVVAGGGQVFGAAFPLADALLLTQVDASFPGEVKLPEIDPAQWCLESEEHWAQDEENEFSMCYQVWQRVGQPSL